MIKIENPLKAWMGDLPSEWSCRRLKYVFFIKKDIAGSENYTVLSVTQQGIIPKDMEAKGQFASDYSKYQLVNKGEFVMNHMDLLTGWVDVSEYDGVTSPDYRVFVLKDEEEFCADYYKYIFQLCYKNKIFYELGQGVSGLGRWRLPADMFLNFELPIPKYIEQCEIASYLKKHIDLADEIIQETKKSLSEYENWKSAKIRECLCQFHDEDKQPVKIKLKYLLEIRSGASKDKEQIMDEGTWPVFGGGGLIGYSDEYNCTKNNLLIGRVGSCGKVTRLKTNSWATDNALIVEPKVNSDYLYYILVDANLQELSTANAQPLITGTKVKSHFVLYYEDENIQTEIVKELDSFCGKINELVKEKNKLIGDLEKYKITLIYELVTGKRRVV